MSKRREDPTARHSIAIFQTTCWKDVEAVKTLDQARQRTAMAALTERYWRPVYWFLRRKGRAHEQAEDLTQGFFQEIVLGHSLFELADRSKGRFRTFLLAALVRYVANQHRHRAAGKRTPRGELRSLEACPAWEEESAVASDPEQAFMYAWATDVLDRAMAEVQERLRKKGMEVHWKVFYARVVAPLTMEAEEPSLGEMCRRYGVEDEKKASNMIITVKRDFRDVLRRILGEGLVCESEVDNEIGELISILSGTGAA